MSSIPVPFIPFRPYQRPQSRVFHRFEEHQDYVHTSVLNSQLDEEELENAGGRATVVASIQHHLPEFDPAEATEPFGPPWLKLIPILRRCGLHRVDETATLTVIKAYLDDAATNSARTPASIKPPNELAALIHPVILSDAWPAYCVGDYPGAVFNAMRAVEIRVRSAGGFSAQDIGTDLMRKAFHPDTGPLADKIAERSERDTVSHLLASAIGFWKNPHSHRKVAVDAEEAIDVIVLASRLMKLIDRRKTVESP